MLSEADSAKIQASVSSLAENVARFDRTVERMVDKMETGNLKRDEAIGLISYDVKDLQAFIKHNKDLPYTVRDLNEWMISVKAKGALINALPGVISGIVGAMIAIGSVVIYFNR